jgi:hypothetical protein
MEHFLKEFVDGEPEFKPEPWYNPDGDCIVYQMADEAVVAERIDEILTIYRSADDNRAIGYQIKGVAALARKFGWDGLRCESLEVEDEGGRVSLAALLLAAYEIGPKTINRRLAYASAIQHPVSIAQDELVRV